MEADSDAGPTLLRCQRLLYLRHGLLSRRHHPTWTTNAHEEPGRWQGQPPTACSLLLWHRHDGLGSSRPDQCKDIWPAMRDLVRRCRHQRFPWAGQRATHRWLMWLSPSGIATIAARAKELGQLNLGKPPSTD